MNHEYGVAWMVAWFMSFLAHNDGISIYPLETARKVRLVLFAR
jgi:hypothetical protein